MECRINQEPGDKIASDDEDNKKEEKEEENEEDAKEESSDSDLGSVVENRDETSEMIVSGDNGKDQKEKAEKKKSGDIEENKDKKKLQDILEDLLTNMRLLNIMGTSRDKGVCPCNLKEAQHVRKMLQDVRKLLGDITMLPQSNETNTKKRISYAVRLAYARISDAVALMERTVPDPKPKPARLLASMIALMRFPLRKVQKASYPNGSVVVSNVEETSRALQAGFWPMFRQCFCEDPLNLVAIRAYVNFAYSSLRVTLYLAKINAIATGGSMGDIKLSDWMYSLRYEAKPPSYSAYYYHLAVFQDCTSTCPMKQYAVKDSLGHTALHLAVLLNRANMLPVLLRRGISPNTRDADTNTPLHAAVVVKDVRQVKSLISYGADLYRKNKDGISALNLVICMDDIDLLNSLLVDPKPQPPFAHFED